MTILALAAKLDSWLPVRIRPAFHWLIGAYVNHCYRHARTARIR